MKTKTHILRMWNGRTGNFIWGFRAIEPTGFAISIPQEHREMNAAAYRYCILMNIAEQGKRNQEKQILQRRQREWKEK